MNIKTSKGFVGLIVLLTLVASMLGGVTVGLVQKVSVKAPAVVIAPPEIQIREVTATVKVREGTYYFLAGNNSDPFYIPGVKGFTDAGNSVAMKTEFVGPLNDNPAETMKTFEELVASPKTKGIFLYPVGDAGEPLIKEAVAKGIPVVIGAADSAAKNRNAFVGYDTYKIGQQAAGWAAKLLDCKGEVGTIAINAPHLIPRINGFNEYIKTLCPDIVVDERASHDGSATNAAATIESYLVAHPKLSLLWFADGGSGQQAGLWKDKQAQGVKTLFLATDMPNATLQAIKDGVFVGSVAQDTFSEEWWAIMLLDAINKGQRVPDTLYLSTLLIDKSNVDQYLTK